MKASELLKLFKKAGKRAHLVGDLDAGAIVALDVEGRWFATLDGEILNRVNPEAIEGQSTREEYLNPGGDGLWPAPEGTTLGYQYSTGKWRVPPGLTSARYLVTQATSGSATVCAEVDLINSQGLGIPLLFQRQLIVDSEKGSVLVRAKESLTYLGRKLLRRNDCLLAPWTLCQFDSGPECEVVFPCEKETSVWDLYEPSDTQRKWKDRFCHTRTDGAQGYQIAIDEKTPWIEFRDPRRGLTVRREAEPVPSEQPLIDIRDADPDVLPDSRGVRYSIYSDASDFMEIEAAGGCPDVLRPNAEMSLIVSTRFART